MNNPYASKYHAANEFRDGVVKAIRFTSPPGFLWKDQTPMFMAGYEYGKAMGPAIAAEINARLHLLGFGSIEAMTLARDIIANEHMCEGDLGSVPM